MWCLRHPGDRSLPLLPADPACPPAVGGELDVSALPEGTPLEACFLLGELRQAGGELAAKAKDDVWMKVRGLRGAMGGGLRAGG